MDRVRRSRRRRSAARTRRGRTTSPSSPTISASTLAVFGVSSVGPNPRSALAFSQTPHWCTIVSSPLRSIRRFPSGHATRQPDRSPMSTFATVHRVGRPLPRRAGPPGTLVRLALRRYPRAIWKYPTPRGAGRDVRGLCPPQSPTAGRAAAGAMYYDRIAEIMERTRRRGGCRGSVLLTNATLMPSSVFGRVEAGCRSAVEFGAQRRERRARGRRRSVRKRSRGQVENRRFAIADRSDRGLDHGREFGFGERVRGATGRCTGASRRTRLALRRSA